MDKSRGLLSFFSILSVAPQDGGLCPPDPLDSELSLEPEDCELLDCWDEDDCALELLCADEEELLLLELFWEDDPEEPLLWLEALLNDEEGWLLELFPDEEGSDDEETDEPDDSLLWLDPLL